MKTYTKPSSRKLVDGFDKQLKSLLTDDLKIFMAKGKLMQITSTSGVYCLKKITLPVSPA